jgi:hypothetical protein
MDDSEKRSRYMVLEGMLSEKDSLLAVKDHEVLLSFRRNLI